LRNRSLPPPILPKIQNQLDTSNFDDYPTDADGPPPGTASRFDSGSGNRIKVWLYVKSVNFFGFLLLQIIYV
jgi:hypothetical protein